MQTGRKSSEKKVRISIVDRKARPTTAAPGRGELNALVGKRFLVTIEGRVGDVKALHEVAGRIDMGKLAALK